jgi:sialic acid synthase SpsE
MIFISTPFRAAADQLNNFDIPAYKIGSLENVIIILCWSILQLLANR